DCEDETESAREPNVLNQAWSRQRLHLDRQHRRQIVYDRLPRVAVVRRNVYLPASGAEIDAALVEPVYGHCIAQNVHIAVLLRQTLAKFIPLIAAAAAAIHTQLAVERKML